MSSSSFPDANRREFITGMGALAVGTALVPAVISAADTNDLEADILRAAANGSSSYRLPKGVVKLARGLMLKKLKNFTLEGEGTTLLCSDWKNWVVRLDGCTGVTLLGFTIDYDPLPFTQGSITKRSVDGKALEITLHEGYPDMLPEFEHVTAHAFEPDQPRWKTTTPDLYPRRISTLNKRHAKLEFGSAPPLKEGDRIVLNLRVSGAIRITQCEDIHMQGVTIHSGPGAAVLCRYMKGDNRFSFDIKPGPKPAGATQPRLFSSSADGFNFAFARRGPVLENSDFSYMGDDSVNLHGPVFMVAAQLSDREIIAGWKWNQEFLPWLIHPGDTVRHLRKGNFAIVGTARLESFTPEKKPDPQWLETIKKHWPRTDSVKGAFRFKFQQPLMVKPGDAFDIIECNSPGFRIANCHFHDHRARGTRIESPQGVIEHNVFERIKMNAITLGPEYGFWREAGWVTDVTIRNNHMSETNLYPIPSKHTAGVISVFANLDERTPLADNENANGHIRIENNVFERCTTQPVYTEYARDVVVTP